MNKLRLIITNEAFSDINLISDFIAKDNQIAAKNFIKNLFNCFETLIQFPDLGVFKNKITDKTVKIFIHNKNYLIAYKVLNDKLVILKVTNRYQNIYDLL